VSEDDPNAVGSAQVLKLLAGGILDGLLEDAPFQSKRALLIVEHLKTEWLRQPAEAVPTDSSHDHTLKVDEPFGYVRTPPRHLSRHE